MATTILQGNVFDLLPTIQPGSVDCCITSPPYWMLRSYLPAGHALKPLELGSEPTPAAYIANMVRVFGLVRECLADHGTCWVNVGDSYSSGHGERGSVNGTSPGHAADWDNLPSRPKLSIDAGNLCLIPQRLAIALQDAGWIVRSIIVWHKPAPMPASISGWMWRRCRVKVKSQPRHLLTSARCGREEPSTELHYAQWQDCPGCPKCTPSGGYVLRRGSWRCTSSWEPILMLAKSPRYFADGEPVKTAPAAATVSRDQYTRILDDTDEQFAVRHDHKTECVSGANARDVQTWAAEPLKEKHYAAYPTKLVEFCLRAGTSARGYCVKCGAPWCRVVEGSPDTEAVRALARNGKDWTARGKDNTAKIGENKHGNDFHNFTPEVRTIDWRPSCRCSDARPPRPGLVLDPFAGSGRTGIAAMRLGLDFVGCELNPDYAEMARKLLKEESPLYT